MDGTGVKTGVWLVAMTLLLHSPLSVDGALNVGAHDTEGLVTTLRQSIFVEAAYLSERQEERCSSLDGPRCLAALLGGGKAGGRDSRRQARFADVLDGPGVVPELLFHDLGAESGREFATPEYSVLSAFREQQHSVASKQALPILAGMQAGTVLDSARKSGQRGIIHFADLLPDSQLPLSFSRGLPSNIVATWDGKWLVRGCSQTWPRLAMLPLEAPLGLPPPQMDGSDKLGYLPATASSADSDARSSQASTVAELTGSVGYLRFSAPVIVRSLFARWHPSKDVPPALVGGRLGLKSMWTTHLDPKKLRGSQGWIDISGGQLKTVDEVAFVATSGLQIGAVEVLAHGGNSSDDDEHSVLVLVPTTGSQEGAWQGKEQAVPQFEMRLEKLTAAAAPYIMSLQEVIDRNLRMHAAPVAQERAHTPGLLTPRSPPLLADEENVTWYAVAAANQAMFAHTSLLQMLLAVPPEGKGGGSHSLARLLDASSASLPHDLQKELLRESAEIGEALLGWLSAAGSWGHGTPLSLPRNSSEEALLKYVTAKRWQTKLDLLTASYLHQRPDVDMPLSSALEDLVAALPLMGD
mmetsp:Transcript_14923/g.42891  ORF Transcript_14923/g.42891 Transcript_14923/m.42891 type:complete len:581 (-) Transcript_14923:217-1959(-)